MIRNFYGVADFHMGKLFGRIHRYQRKSGNTGTFPWTCTSRKLFVSQIKKKPLKYKEMLIDGVRERLGDDYDIDKHFTPKYMPWDQRLCLVPNGDIFEAINSGKASVVTDTIDEFTSEGIKLDSGEELKADIIITATGLNMRLLNGIDIKIDNQTLDISEKIQYKTMMFRDCLL